MKIPKFFSNSGDAVWFDKPNENPSIDKWIHYWKHNRWIIVPSHQRPGIRTQICFIACMEYTDVDGIEVDLLVVPRNPTYFGVRFGDLPKGVKHVDFPLMVFDDLTAQTGKWYRGVI